MKTILVLLLTLPGYLSFAQFDKSRDAVNYDLATRYKEVAIYTDSTVVDVGEGLRFTYIFIEWICTKVVVCKPGASASFLLRWMQTDFHIDKYYLARSGVAKLLVDKRVIEVTGF